MVLSKTLHCMAQWACAYKNGSFYCLLVTSCIIQSQWFLDSLPLCQNVNGNIGHEIVFLKTTNCIVKLEVSSHMVSKKQNISQITVFYTSAWFQIIILYPCIDLSKHPTTSSLLPSLSIISKQFTQSDVTWWQSFCKKEDNQSDLLW